MVYHLPLGQRYPFCDMILLCVKCVVVRVLYHSASTNSSIDTLQHAVTHCNTLQHTAAHCSTLQPTLCKRYANCHMTHAHVISLVVCVTHHSPLTHCITLQHAATHCSVMQLNALQYFQHNAKQCKRLPVDSRLPKSTNAGDQTPNIWISRSNDVLVFEIFWFFLFENIFYLIFFPLFSPLFFPRKKLSESSHGPHWHCLNTPQTRFMPTKPG